MDDQPCHCLLDQEPLAEASWDARDRDTADKIRRFGWASLGIADDEQTPGWAYSIGLWHTLRSPEACIFGLPRGTGMKIVNVVGGLVRGGAALQPGRRADVLEGYEVMLRPAHPRWYPRFFGTAIDFYTAPPLPIVQVFWPDREGRFPWEDGVDEGCRISQPLLWLPPDEHPPGIWSEFEPYRGWPFRTSLPYFPAHTTQAVIDGAAPVASVVRAADGAWTFLDGSGGPATELSNLRHMLNTHPDIAAVADLADGERADRQPDNSWKRTASLT